MTILTLFMTCNPFICTNVYSLSESSKITLFKDLVGKIIEAKVAEKGLFLLFSVTVVFGLSKSS